MECFWNFASKNFVQLYGHVNSFLCQKLYFLLDCDISQSCARVRIRKRFHKQVTVNLLWVKLWSNNYVHAISNDILRLWQYNSWEKSKIFFQVLKTFLEKVWEHFTKRRKMSHIVFIQWCKVYSIRELDTVV